MTGEKVKFEQPANQDSAENGEPKYERSTIEFPYGDLDDAMEVVTAIHSQYGVSCDTDQVAAALKQSAKSGAFRLKTASAKTFGLTENERGTVRLTALAQDIVNPQKMRRSKADAFLNVPLYKAVYDQFRGNTLPPAPALERIMQQLGVAPKQATRARQVFERAAEQAGYFEAGKDRLVRPGNLGSEPAIDPEMQARKDAEEKAVRAAVSGGGGVGGGSGSDGKDDLHPFIRGLLDTLPKPKTDWSAENRAEWLQAAAQVFKLIYKGDSDGAIGVTFTRKSGANGGSEHDRAGQAR